MRRGPLSNRIAAATGIDFAVLGIVLTILAEVKDLENSGDFVTATNEVWGAYTLILAFAAVSFLWFTSIFAARLRQVEDATGTSGRLANVVLGAGSAFSGALIAAVAVQWAARELAAPGLAVLSTAILEGPPVAFLAAAYIGAAGLAIFRAGGTVAAPSRVVAQLSLVLAPAFLAIGSIQLFNNYAWIDETGRLVFFAWVIAVSAIGVQRWGTIDEGWEPGDASAPAPATTMPLEPLPRPEPLRGPERSVTAARSKPAAKRKPAPRKTTPRKR